ncbi:hypothetical protein SAMN05192564_101312 [Paraburkholderia sartisoli]|uniref:Uncharacterized protein n=1 Tax=Paraburkholderia sartisoli TaxID=83784 RepID=A0A1H3YHG5_9BURK|nr:hypothetical protein SAMN05192564_101312 [Paraburkholderia sartisoli]
MVRLHQRMIDRTGTEPTQFAQTQACQDGDSITGSSVEVENGLPLTNNVKGRTQRPFR